MRIAEFLIALGGTLIVLFLALFLSKREIPTVVYDTAWNDLTLRHTNQRTVIGKDESARFDVEVIGGLLPDSGALAVYLRPYFHGATGVPAEFKSAPMLTVPGEGLVYRRELVNQGVGSEFEYYLRLSAIVDSTGTDSTLATIPAQFLLDQSSTLKIRFEGKPNSIVLVAHIAFMYAALLIVFLAVFSGLADKNTANLSARCGKLVLVATALLLVGVFILGTVVERQSYGTFWSGIPVSTNLTDTYSLLLCLYWVGLLVCLKGSAFKSNPERDLISRQTARILTVVGLIGMIVIFLLPHGTGRI